MNGFESVTKPLRWFMALLMVALATGCGGGGGQGPILGGGGAANPATAAAAAAVAAAAVAAAAAAACVPVVAPLTIPTVTATDPTDLNLKATTSTGTPGGNKLITATFSLPMTAATITSTTFTLTQLDALGAIVAVVTPTAPPTYNAATNVATLTVPALLPGTKYKAIITNAVTSASPPAVAPTAMSCSKVWTFTTVTPVAVGLAPINMGLAAPFGISATAGLATAISPSTVNGNVLLDPLAQCNATVVTGAGGIGSCLAIGFPPTVNGTVISALFNPGLNLATIKADLNAAYLSLTPPGGPPAAGSLGGATAIAAPTTLGGAVGLPYTVGVNYFTPGVYQSITSIMVTGDLTLDAQGNPDAVFVFQSSSTIGTAAGAAPPMPPGTHTRILLIGGAKASNVWWQAGSSATLGLYSEFQGNILAAVSVTLNNGATSCGRMMAGAWVGGGGAITLGGGNVVSVPGQPFVPPATYSPICL